MYNAIIRELTREQAQELLSALWWGGKNSTSVRRMQIDHTSNHDGSGYVIANIPLAMVRPNEEGDRYDSTVDIERARRYAEGGELAPVQLLCSERAVKRGAKFAAVNDGGHPGDDGSPARRRSHQCGYAAVGL